MGNPFNPAADISFLSYVPPLNFFERLSNFVNYFRIKYEFRRLAKQQDVYVQKYFGPGYPSAADLPTDYSLLLANYDPILQGIRPFLPSIVPIAGLHIIDRNETIPQVGKYCIIELEFFMLTNKRYISTKFSFNDI